MGRFIPLKFQLVRIFIFINALNICQNLLAAQDAMVIVDSAIIYADAQMSAPVGFVRKGKKIKVGEIPRNKAQVYPIIVSGKIAYIRVIDVSTEKESVDSPVLVVERFQNVTVDEHKSNYSLSFFNYSTQINLLKENDRLKDGDPVNWYGVSIRGGVQASPRWDFDVLINVMSAKAEREVFRAVEFGLGGAARIIDMNRFKLKLFGQFLVVPFATYALSDDYRVNGYGFSTGGGLSMTLRLGKNFGLEGYGGFYYTKLSGFQPPNPYDEIAPTFIGNRIGAGLNYQF